MFRSGYSTQNIAIHIARTVIVKRSTSFNCCDKYDNGSKIISDDAAAADDDDDNNDKMERSGQSVNK